MSAQVDHLVIAADTLAQGEAWCRQVLGVEAGPGGEHPLMGTHNKLLRIAGPQFPRAYLEIIAINPGAADPGRTRWFDLDDAHLRAAVKHEPRLVHFVANTQDAAAAMRALAGLGIDRGALLHAERPTPRGLLQWQISVRADGQRLFYGALPTLIQWGEVHAADGLAPSELSLTAMAATHPRPDDLRAAYVALGLQQVAVQAGPPNLCATLTTPRGAVTLESKGT
ncbi:MAG: VOC family protein [Burkholderiales bacterium]|nr:VOC family protein [Burkholderiales bacterium]